MNKEFLSICIPTRNRSLWLEKALSRLTFEIKANNLGPEVIKIYVSDNCSTDDTEAKVKRFQEELPHLIYSKHDSNLGGDSNIVYCCGLGAGEYRWVMGDDDSICRTTLVYILSCLRDRRPALFINSDGRYACGFKTPVFFENYREFAKLCMSVNPHMLLAHSLISANIFRVDCFNQEFAASKIKTSYGHMYGIIESLSDKTGVVFVTDRQTITVRDSSLDPVDGVWPSDIYMLWGDYLDWIKRRFELNELNCNDIHNYVHRAMILEFKAHLFKTVWRYVMNLNRMQTWKAFMKQFKNLRPGGRNREEDAAV